MEFYFIEKDKKKYYLSVLPTTLKEGEAEIVWIDGFLPGEWKYSINDNIIVRKDIFEQYPLQKTIINLSPNTNKKESCLELLLRLLNSQLVNFSYPEYWSKIQYEIIKTEQDIIVWLKFINIGFYFDKQGNFKGISNFYVS